MHGGDRHRSGQLESRAVLVLSLESQVRLCGTLGWEHTERETHPMSGVLSEGFRTVVTTVTTGSLGGQG